MFSISKLCRRRSGFRLAIVASLVLFSHCISFLGSEYEEIATGTLEFSDARPVATLSYEHDDIKLDRLNVSVKDDIEWNRELWFQDPMQRMRDMNAFSKVRFAGRNDEREPLHIHIRHRAENGAIDIVNAVKDMKADGFLD